MKNKQIIQTTVGNVTITPVIIAENHIDFSVMADIGAANLHVRAVRITRDCLGLHVAAGIGVGLDALRMCEWMAEEYFEVKNPMEDFLRDIEANYDHDSDAHKYNTSCRVCEAEKLRRQLFPRNADRARAETPPAALSATETPTDATTTAPNARPPLDPDAILKAGGAWLATVRGWIQGNKVNGSSVKWGSSDALQGPVTVRELEEVAAAAVAADRNDTPYVGVQIRGYH